MIAVYTKTGDKGESGLITGERVSKASAVFHVLGTLDELNAQIGLCVVDLARHTEAELHPFAIFLQTIQNTLFIAGAEVAGSTKTVIIKKDLQTLEHAIDDLQSQLEDRWYQKFILPGGSVTAAHLDIARTVCRRCERMAVALHEEREQDPLVLSYVNRLSDYLYVLRVFVNKVEGVEEKIFTS